uniref:Phosphatidylinositol-specific phospholipase C X domain-containing protein n=1 Tax=Spermophilus dauricus TaxID=99837 RepID=A0A8C9Q9W2_SPEDA
MGGRVSASGSFRSLPCANANADWMSALCPRLWDVPLQHLSIPGSHDTMTYCLNKKSPVSHSESRLLQLLSKVLPCVTRPVVLRWSVTQALDVTQQLDAGVRYLDLRIAHMLEGSEKNLHFVHMVYTTALVEDTLTEISEWNFEGMTEDLHEYLVACIKNIFGDMLCPRGVRRVPVPQGSPGHCVQGLVCVSGLAGTSRSGTWPCSPGGWGGQRPQRSEAPETLPPAGWLLQGQRFLDPPGGCPLLEALGIEGAHPELFPSLLPPGQAWARLGGSLGTGPAGARDWVNPDLLQLCGWGATSGSQVPLNPTGG